VGGGNGKRPTVSGAGELETGGLWQVAGGYGMSANMRDHTAFVAWRKKAAGPDMVLDVGAVALISVEGVRFLNSCEDDGIAIKNASPYISEWMALERKTGPKGP